MLDLFIVLLFSHLLGDFILQTNRIVKMKRKIWGQLIHCLIIVIAILFMIPTRQGLFIAWIVGATHLIIDFLKIIINKDRSLNIFILDQVLHLFVIIFVVFTFGQRYELFWFYQSRSGFLSILLFFIGIMLNTSVANWIVVKFFQSNYPDENFEMGLNNAGKYIGYLERIIIYLMVLTNNIAGIGFLVTAKSILRFGKLNPSEKKESEYIILGTFLSFALALIWSYSVNYLLELV